ncbi:MAG: MFS transporter [Firmicutes bacterium]|nr:MFS transporter [Bacillota bacterium]
MPASIYVIFTAGIINSMGNFVFPFLTLYLTSKQGMTEAQAGFFLLVAAGMYPPGAMVGGKLADHFGRKKVLVGGMALAALLLIPCAFLPSPQLTAWLIIASRFFASMSDPAQGAVLIDLTNSSNRKATFSLLYLGHNIGFAVGPTLAGVLFRNHLPWIFIGDALTTLISIALVACFVPETIPRGDVAPESEHGNLSPGERAESGGLLPALLRRPVLVISSFILLVYSFVYSQHIFTLPLQLKGLYGDNGPLYFGTLMSVNALTVVGFTSILTVLTLRLKPVAGMGLGGLFYAAGFGLIFAIRSMPLFYLSTFIWTLGEILVTTNTGVFIADNTPVSHRGRFNSVLNVISGAGFAAGPWLTGLWLRRTSTQMIWAYMFFLALGASLLMFVLDLARSKTHVPAETE